MIRFFLLEVLMAVLAFATGWLGRRVLGRLIGGPPVILWGAVLGLVAMVGFGVWFVQVPFFNDFIDLNNDAWTGARTSFLRFWDTGIIGGIIGALFASIPFRHRQNQGSGHGQVLRQDHHNPPAP